MAESFAPFQASLMASLQGSDANNGSSLIDIVNEIEKEAAGRFDVDEVPVVKQKIRQQKTAQDLAIKYANFDSEILEIMKSEKLLSH